MIHPSAIIHPLAEIGPDVSVGPLCVIEAGAQIGRECRLESHVVIKTGTRLGERNCIGEATVLGAAPQHLTPEDEPGQLVLGNDNIIREHVTIHRGYGRGAKTTLGDRNMLMVNAHVAHDCQLGNSTIIANNVMLAGHVTVGDRAYLAGAVGVHQFCRIGQYTMVGGQAAIKKDVPPFAMVDGASNQLVGLNSVGLRRNGFSREEMEQLKDAYRMAFRGDLPWKEMLIELEKQFPCGRAGEFAKFLASSERGCLRERRSRQPTIRFPGDNADEKPTLRRAG